MAMVDSSASAGKDTEHMKARMVPTSIHKTGAKCLYSRKGCIRFAPIWVSATDAALASMVGGNAANVTLIRTAWPDKRPRQ